MVTIRLADKDDVPVLVAMGRRFLASSAYASAVLPTDDEVEDSLLSLVAHGVVFVADKDGVPVGMLAGAMSRIWFCPRPVAAELAWWVDEEYRGGTAGIRLVQQFQDWARLEGAKFVVMSDQVGGDPHVGPMLLRMGFADVERSWMQEVV